MVCKFKETYLVGSTQTTSASTDDSSRVFFNHYNGRINSFTNLAAYADKTATDRPAVIDIIEGSSTYYVPYFATTTAGIGTKINGVAATVTPTVANTIQNINIADPAATADYTPVIGGVTFNVRLVCENIFTAYTIHFLNKLGGFESMGFNKGSKKTFEIERKQWQQLPYRVDASGVVTVKSGSIMHPQKSTFGVRMTEKLKLATDLLSNAEHKWLQQLITSPLVYLEEAGTLYPIVIAASNYDVKNYDIDGLQQLSIDVEFGQTFKTQFQ